MHLRKSFLVFLLLSLLFHFSVGADEEKFPYFSDLPNPSFTEREPPYEGTRKQIEHQAYYLNIRYPYHSVRVEKEAGLFMKFSLGNETQKPISFKVLRLELSHGQEIFPIKPFFYDQTTGEKKEGWEDLKNYEHEIQPDVHREISVLVSELAAGEESLVLDLEIEISYQEKTDTLKEHLVLYRGYYGARPQ